MRPSVAAAWPGHAALYEGRLNHMYLDTLGLVTTGIGYLIDREGGATPPPSALALPWLTASGARASQESIAAEWKAIKARTDLARLGGRAFAAVAVLHLDWSTVDGLLGPKTATFWARLALSLPSLEAWPADAQMAALDLAWQNGPAFLDSKLADGAWRWPNMRAALLARDFTAAALAVPDPRPDAGDDDHGDRAEYRKRLFRNAARVVALRLDPAVLWDTKTPTAPPVVAPPKPAPAPAPVQETRMYSNTYRSDYVEFRGGYFTPTDRDTLLAIPSPVRVTQGGLSFAPASAKTHAGLGAFDLNTDSMTKEQVWEMSRELLRSGITPFPRGFVWDSFQGRTLGNTDDGNEHLHCVSNNSFASLHPEAQAQIREQKRGGDGLVGSAGYTGPSTPLGTWKGSPYNPVNINPVERRVYVQVDALQGTDIDRRPTVLRHKGEGIDSIRYVKRWGRWNAVTSSGTYFATKDRAGVYLAYTKP